MKSCCDAYGDCTQGRTCPARTQVVLPHQAAHARRMQALVTNVPGVLHSDDTPETIGPTSPVADLLDVRSELRQIIFLLALFLAVGMTAIAMVLGYGWGQVGRDWLLGLLAS